MVLGVHVSVVFLRILASFRVIFWQPGWNVSHFNYLKVNMAWKIIAAYLKGLSKYRKMAFFVLEILVIFVCTLPSYSGYHCKIDRFLHMRTSFFLTTGRRGTSTTRGSPSPWEQALNFKSERPKASKHSRSRAKYSLLTFVLWTVKSVYFKWDPKKLHRWYISNWGNLEKVEQILILQVFTVLKNLITKSAICKDGILSCKRS